LSAGILVCLSLDRFYSILFPLYVINAKRSVQRMVTTAWLISAFSSLPQVIRFQQPLYLLLYSFFTDLHLPDGYPSVLSRIHGRQAGKRMNKQIILKFPLLFFQQCVSADLIGQLSPRLVYWFSVLNIVQVIPLFLL